MRLRISAKRWDEPIEHEVESFTLTTLITRPGWVRLEVDGNFSMNIELNDETGEKVEVLP